MHDRVPGQQLLTTENTGQFRMVAELRFTMREGSGATEDRETVEEYIEETRETYNEHRMIEEKYETSDDIEVEYQIVRMYSEYKEGTIG
eukprot:938581-Amphidinium_carterae.1